jgi:hypothetical protein
LGEEGHEGAGACGRRLEKETAREKNGKKNLTGPRGRSLRRELRKRKSTGKKIRKKIMKEARWSLVFGRRGSRGGRSLWREVRKRKQGKKL